MTPAGPAAAACTDVGAIPIRADEIAKTTVAAPAMRRRLVGTMDACTSTSPIEQAHSGRGLNTRKASILSMRAGKHKDPSESGIRLATWPDFAVAAIGRGYQ